MPPTLKTSSATGVGSTVATKHRNPRGPLQPIGSIRTWNLRNAGGMVISRVNFIKTQNGWMRAAAWNWLEHHGNIPDGFRVIHRNPLDALNDDISNLILSPIGDIVDRIQSSLASSAALRRKKRSRGIGKANAMRARINATIEIKPGHWYPVIREPYKSSSDGVGEPERGTIFMHPTRTRTVNGWPRFRVGMLSIVRGLDLVTLDEYSGMRREVFEEIQEINKEEQERKLELWEANKMKWELWELNRSKSGTQQ